MLNLLDPLKISASDVEALWQKVKGVVGALDDRLKERGDLFCQSLFNEYYIMLGDKGMIKIGAVVRGAEANIHVVVWDRTEPVKLALTMRDILRKIFEHFDLVRLTSITSEKNEEAIRLAKAMGFQVEGKLRKASLFEGQYCDSILLGLLREDLDKEK